MNMLQTGKWYLSVYYFNCLSSIASVNERIQTTPSNKSKLLEIELYFIWTSLWIKTCKQPSGVSKIEKVAWDVRSAGSGKLQVSEKYWSQQTEHLQVQNGTAPGVLQVSGGVSVLCRLATHIANVLLEPLAIRWTVKFGNNFVVSYKVLSNGGYHYICSSFRMSFNIHERGIAYCLIRSLFRPYNLILPLAINESLFAKLIKKTRYAQNKTCIREASPGVYMTPRKGSNWRNSAYKGNSFAQANIVRGPRHGLNVNAFVPLKHCKYELLLQKL